MLKKIENIGDQLKGYTEKLVFSFADIASYRKVKKNLEDNNVPYQEWTEDQMEEFAQRLVQLNKDKDWNYQLATCGEKNDFDGIKHNHCIDDELMIRRAFNDKELMTFLKAKIQPLTALSMFGDLEPLQTNAIILDNGYYVTRADNKDKGQREFCGCMKSKDIGQYNTCIHMCEYCYANTSKQAAATNYKCHKDNPMGETITGK